MSVYMTRKFNTILNWYLLLFGRVECLLDEITLNLCFTYYLKCYNLHFLGFISEVS
jgi:hypothetical protein